MKIISILQPLEICGFQNKHSFARVQGEITNNNQSDMLNYRSPLWPNYVKLKQLITLNMEKEWLDLFIFLQRVMIVHQKYTKTNSVLV